MSAHPRTAWATPSIAFIIALLVSVAREIHIFNTLCLVSASMTRALVVVQGNAHLPLTYSLPQLLQVLLIADLFAPAPSMSGSIEPVLVSFDARKSFRSFSCSVRQICIFSDRRPFTRSSIALNCCFRRKRL